MTWEWALVLCVLLLCATAIFILRVVIVERHESSEGVDLAPLQSEVDKIKADHERIEKLAEETKKMLSNANMAAGLRGHR